MDLTALWGALGFLTRLPVGRSEQTWDAFGSTPAAMVPVGYFIGGVAAFPFLLAFPSATIGVGYVLVLVALTGIAHLDGLADVGDAAVVHGSASDRREAMRDTILGVGGATAVGIDIVGLVLAGVAIASIPWPVAAGLVVAAEVGAKLGMVLVAVRGHPTHEGLGSHVSGAGFAHLVLGGAIAAPAAILGWPSAAPALGLSGALLAAVAVRHWARIRLGGVNGDVLGAANEIVRLVALHVGVVAWTLS